MKAELTFGEWLRRRRGGLGLTQKALAQRVGYAEVTLRKVEADELRPSRQMAEKLAEALQLAPEEWSPFVRFARAEPGWDEVTLPTHVSPAVPPIDRPGRARSISGELWASTGIVRGKLGLSCRIRTQTKYG